MIDYMLRTDTEVQMDTALKNAGLLYEYDQGNNSIILIPTSGAYLDRIGIIPPQFDINGNIIKQGDSRYHVNLRMTVPLIEEQEALLPKVDLLPTTPYRVFV